MPEERPFDCVRMMREIREQISREMDGMTFEERRLWIQEQLAKAKGVQDAVQGEAASSTS
ncbi:MAG TPA: hypothetical protein VF710_08260 [Longimicrobium sp.]